ncbi:M23 family metallopeptidase [Bacteroidota bacterium]
MARYKYNPVTLSYEKIEISLRSRIFNYSFFFLLLISMIILIFSASQDLFQRPKMVRLIAERQQLISGIDYMNQEVSNYDDVLKRIAHNDDQLYRVFFEVDPIPESKRNAGTGGSRQYQTLESKPNSELLISVYSNIDEVSRHLVIQSKSFDEVIDMAKNKEKRMAAKPSIQPISQKDLIRFGSAFGIRLHPILKKIRPHNGIDLTAPFGSEIYATADGVVVQASYSSGGYGKRIIIDHGYGYKTLYGHCSSFLVKKGQEVKRGEVIGKVGNTGLSTRSHLHYEVWVSNKPVDPINYYASDLSPDEFERMVNLLANADPSFDIN